MFFIFRSRGTVIRRCCLWSNCRRGNCFCCSIKEGARVLLVEPGKNVGGMVTGGLSHTDYGDRTVIGGLTYQFYQKVAEHYKTHVFYWRGPEPHVGEQIMLDWLKNSKWIYGSEKEYAKVEKRKIILKRLSLLIDRS